MKVKGLRKTILWCCVKTQDWDGWPFNRRLGWVNPRRELLRVGKGLLGLRSPVARGNWSGHMR